MPLVRRLDQELKATAMVSAPRHKHIRPIILGGFRKTDPSYVKLWEIPTHHNDLRNKSEATIWTTIKILALQVAANKEQVEAVQKAFNAPAGFTLIHGGPNTGKTTVLMLQALTAVANGHKVLISAPEKGKSSILARFGKGMPRLPNNKVPKIYVANSTSEDQITFTIFEFRCAQHELDDKPHTLAWAILQAAQSDSARLLKPQNQAMLNYAGQYYPHLQPLADSYQFLTLLDTITESSPEADLAHFYLLHKKLLYRIIGDADVLITTCQDAGNEDLYLNFSPAVVIIDKATECAETEAFIPLLMYQAVHFRILIGNEHDTRLPLPEPWSPGLVQHQTTFFARMKDNGAPVHSLIKQYPGHAHQKGIEVPVPAASLGIHPALQMTPVVKLKDIPLKLDHRCGCGSGKLSRQCNCKIKSLVRSKSVPGRNFMPLTPVAEESGSSVTSLDYIVG